MWFNRRKSVRLPTALLSRLLVEVGPGKFDWDLALEKMARVDTIAATDVLGYLYDSHPPEVIHQLAQDHGFDVGDVPHPHGCVDCNLNVMWIREDFVVREDVWGDAGLEYGDGRCLCLRCVERRLGRKLRRRDFADSWLSAVDRGQLSERLQSRLLR